MYQVETRCFASQEHCLETKQRREAEQIYDNELENDKAKNDKGLLSDTDKAIHVY